MIDTEVCINLVEQNDNDINTLHNILSILNKKELIELAIAIGIPIKHSLKKTRYIQEIVQWYIFRAQKRKISNYP